MHQESFIGKIICAIGLAAIMGLFISDALGGLLMHSAATETQIFWVKTISGSLSAIIGGCLGWVHSQLIITGAVFSLIANAIIGLFSL